MDAKYAVAHVMDQTIGYLTDVRDLDLTTKHPEAKLWDKLEDAAAVISETSAKHAMLLLRRVQDNTYDLGGTSDERIVIWASYFIEVVEDEAEFRAREDTW